MYAIVESGGKQYKVTEGETIKLEKLPVEEGAEIELDKVLMLANTDDIKLGAPYVEGSKVKATVLGHGRHKKVNIIKFRRRKQSKTQMGHRQWYTELKITGIQ